MKLPVPTSPLLAVLHFFAAPGRAHAGHCPRCERPTAWSTHAIHGTYRCTRCGDDPVFHADA